LPGDILTKVDRASMAHGLEVRVPMLDHTLVEWAATLPSKFKLHGSEGKYILKRAMTNYIPHDVMYRPKMGFAVPIASWFRGPLRERLHKAVLDDAMLGNGIFDATAVRTLLREHDSGAFDHSTSLWSLLMYAGFQRTLESQAA
jgi:asparagine synthase (glutamine-hydrolysing)